jgi:hypothetical protein
MDQHLCNYDFIVVADATLLTEAFVPYKGPLKVVRRNCHVTLLDF